MKLSKCLTVLAFFILPALILVAQDDRKIDWTGNIYTKWLDGDRRTNTGLYNNSEFGNGDTGQGTEFELFFKAKVSRQIEIGGRIKARFDRNFWSNGGGFADDENEPKSAQYMKFRGAYVRVTPGYSWIDSATIGSNDWGQFDALTFGKIRYIDRDNISGLLFQGSNQSKSFRWDVARVSLPKLWAGPNFSTGDLSQSDAAYVGQGRFTTGDWTIDAIGQYVIDREISGLDQDNRDGVDLSQRYRNTVMALKAKGSVSSVDLAAAYYHSDFYTVFEGTGNTRFTPTLNGAADDDVILFNIDVNDIAEGFTIRGQYFDVGAAYMSVMAARRESDILLTEGHDGSWGWSRPDYNVGSNARGSARSGIGYGGWDGHAAQVVSINADNDFTDFDEQMSESVLGWKGFTIAPELEIGDLSLTAEYTSLDYNTNWQAYGESSADLGIYPGMDGVHSWGLGGDWRSPYSAYQDKKTTIALIKGDYVVDVGEGIELKFRYKVVNDEDKRVTNPALLSDAYRFPASVITDVAYDDRDADYTAFGLSAGYQLTRDLYGMLEFERFEVDLVDGSIDMTPPLMDSWEPEFGWINYLTGDHEKNKIGIHLKYFLSGMEFGLKAQFFDGSYTPRFYNGVDGKLVEFQPTGATVQTAIGAISTAKVDLEQYRLKAFMKVQF
ncbi:MAG: hypothetical protein H6510_07520 [Acidobacteria bacterium]|nr:hypothetical protein [Acidobacteriota bacterium]MCB9397646.1 hypothetical protein [Acidobacteriota bacterium]